MPFKEQPTPFNLQSRVIAFAANTFQISSSPERIMRRLTLVWTLYTAKDRIVLGWSFTQDSTGLHLLYHRIFVSMGSKRRDGQASTLAECALTIRDISSLIKKPRPLTGCRSCLQEKMRRSVAAVGGALRPTSRSPTQYSFAHCFFHTSVRPHIGANQADVHRLECNPLQISGRRAICIPTCSDDPTCHFYTP